MATMTKADHARLAELRAPRPPRPRTWTTQERAQLEQAERHERALKLEIAADPGYLAEGRALEAALAAAEGPRRAAWEARTRRSARAHTAVNQRKAVNLGKGFDYRGITPGLDRAPTAGAWLADPTPEEEDAERAAISAWRALKAWKRRPMDRLKAVEAGESIAPSTAMVAARRAARGLPPLEVDEDNRANLRRRRSA